MNNRSTVSKKPAIKRVSLTGVQKRDLCLKKKDPNLTHASLAKLYGIKENTVSTILKNSSYWLNIGGSFSLAKRKREVITNYIRQQNQEFVITHEEFKTLLNI